MRILIFHPHLDVKGGSERLTRLLSEGLKEAGVSVLVVSLRRDPEWFDDVLTIEDPRDLNGIVKRYDPDWFFLAISETHYLRFLQDGPRVAMYVHFPLEEEVTEENIEDYRRAGRFIEVDLEELKRVERIFVNSSFTARAVRMVWGRDSVVAHPPLEGMFLEEGARVRDFPPPRIIYVGRFTPLKRQDFLIMSLEVIRRAVPQTELILAGFPDRRHGGYFEQIQRLSERVGGVRIAISPDDRELLQLYRGSRVYAHPRIGEHFGITPCEAMACGIPIVMRGPTGLKDITDRFIAESDWSFLEAIIEVLKMEEGKWFELSSTMRERVLGLTPRGFAEKILGGLR